MTFTPVLGADELVGGQDIPETTVNENNRRLEQLAQYGTVKDKVHAAPPGSPADGDAYIVAGSPTGAWTGKAKAIAFYQAGSGWKFVTPRQGFLVWVQDEALLYYYSSGAVWTSYSAGAISGYTIDTDGTLAANSDTRLATQKAVKSYVDNKVAGLSWKQSVRAATTAAGTLASSFANASVIDGVTLATGDRILVKNQATASENGIYTVAASGAPTRATDADSGAELVNATVYVSEGTTNADTQWTCSTNATITVGSTALAFAQLAAGGGGGGGGSGSGLWGSLVSIPTQSGIGFSTWLNQGSASATDFAGGIGFTLPSDGNELRGLTKAVPSTPYTITILAAPFLNGENGVCLGWYDGSSKAQVLNFRSDATVLIYDFSSPSVRNSGHDQLNGLDRDNLWMQISDNGTTVSNKISRDGFNFVTIYSVAKSSGYLGSSGYTNLFLGGCDYLTAGGGSVLSYS